MSVQTLSPPVTAEEMLDMPDDGFRYELIKGEVKKMPPAGEEHGSIAMLIGSSLHRHVKKNNLGRVFTESGYLLEENPDTVRAPDVAFVRRERIEEAGILLGYRTGAPDLAVEVISPNDRYTEVEEKVQEWLSAGCRMVLVVNPRVRTVAAYRAPKDVDVLDENDEIDGGDVVPGWTMPVKELFA